MNKLNKQEVCERLGVCSRQLDYMINRDEFPRGVRQGKVHLWAESVVDRFDQERFQHQMDWFERSKGV
jgi:predicted DNA-binding transcriptional regulator AlpA